MVPNTRRRAPRRPRIATTSARCSSSPGARDAPMSARWDAQLPNFQHRRVLIPPRWRAIAANACHHPDVPVQHVHIRQRFVARPSPSFVVPAWSGNLAATVLLLSHLELPSVANPRLAPLPLISFAWPLLRLLSASPCSPFANTLDIRTSRIRPAHLLVSTLPPCLVFPQPSPYFATVLCSHRLPLPSVPARTQNLTKHPCHAPRAFWAPRAPNAPPSLTCLAPIASARRLFILTRLLHPRSYRPPRVAPRSTSITLEPTLLLTHSLPLALSLARAPLARLGVRTHPSPHRNRRR